MIYSKEIQGGYSAANHSKANAMLLSKALFLMRLSIGHYKHL